MLCCNWGSVKRIEEIGVYFARPSMYSSRLTGTAIVFSVGS